MIFMRSAMEPFLLKSYSNKQAGLIDFYTNEQGQYAPCMRALGNTKNGLFYYPAKFNRKSFEFMLSG